jgi:hypothetical protein
VFPNLALKWTQRIVVVMCKVSYLDAARRVVAGLGLTRKKERLASLIHVCAVAII